MSTLQPARFRSWGGTTRPIHFLARPHRESELPPLMAEAQAQGKKILAVGLGRSYGDSCLNSDGALMVMTNLRRVLRFDRDAGTIRAEAGIPLQDFNLNVVRCQKRLVFIIIVVEIEALSSKLLDKQDGVRQSLQAT